MTRLVQNKCCAKPAATISSCDKGEAGADTGTETCVQRQVFSQSAVGGKHFVKLVAVDVESNYSAQCAAIVIQAHALRCRDHLHHPRL